LTSAFPTYISYFSEALSIGRRLDLLVIVSVLFVITLTFHNHVMNKKNQKKLETAVRKLAIDNEKKDH